MEWGHQKMPIRSLRGEVNSLGGFHDKQHEASRLFVNLN